MGFFQTLLDLIFGIGDFISTVLGMVVDLISGMVQMVTSLVALPAYLSTTYSWLGIAGPAILTLAGTTIFLITFNIISKVKP